MNKIIKNTLLATACLGTISTTAIAGNKDRAGQAGATELLINPWANSTGLFGLDVANVRGLSAMKVNIAGLVDADPNQNLEIAASYNNYLTGSGISIMSAGMALRLSESAVLGVSAMSMSFGELDVTSIENPEGDGSKFKPVFLNVSMGFGYKFSEKIRGGVNATFVSENVGNISASGMALDAGIQYVTGKDNNLRIGVTLRNAGTNMRFAGGGFSTEGSSENGNFAATRSRPQEKFQLPTYMSMGISYDIYLDEHNRNGRALPYHRLTPMFTFTSNSFNNDYLGLGAEYGYKNMFMVRAAYRYEKDIFSKEKSTTLYTGLSVGASVKTSIKNGPSLAFDYSFRPTRRPDNGIHVFGIRMMFNKKSSESVE
jgi:hypothetical protein